MGMRTAAEEAPVWAAAAAAFFSACATKRGAVLRVLTTGAVARGLESVAVVARLAAVVVDVMGVWTVFGWALVGGVTVGFNINTFTAFFFVCNEHNY